jgi:hypothetical protein
MLAAARRAAPGEAGRHRARPAIGEDRAGDTEAPAAVRSPKASAAPSGATAGGWTAAGSLVTLVRPLTFEHVLDHLFGVVAFGHDFSLVLIRCSCPVVGQWGRARRGRVGAPLWPRLGPRNAPPLGRSAHGWTYRGASSVGFCLRPRSERAQYVAARSRSGRISTAPAEARHTPAFDGRSGSCRGGRRDDRSSSVAPVTVAGARMPAQPTKQ